MAMTTVSTSIAEFDGIWPRMLAAEGRLAAELSTLAKTIDAPWRSRGRAATLDDHQRRIAAIRLEIRVHLMQANSVKSALDGLSPASMEHKELRRIAEIRNLIAAATRRYLFWGRVGPAVSDACRFRGHPLDGEVDEAANTLAGQLVRVLSDGLGSLHGIANPAWEQEATEGFGAFADIPMNAALFAGLALTAWRIAQAVGRRDRLRFLDVGCGGGLRVVQAAQIFDEAHGLDYGETYVRAARRVLKTAVPGRAAAFCADARTFDGYGDYDVIYFYRPMRDPDGLQALEDRILQLARPGTVLVAPYSQFKVRPPAATVSGVCHVVGLTPAAAARTARTAERIGLRTRKFTLPRWSEPGPYRPLIDALDRNGFAVP